MRTVAFYGVVATGIVILIASFGLFATHSGSEYTSEAIHRIQQLHEPQRPPAFQNPAGPPPSPPLQAQPFHWEWKYARDRKNYGLSEAQCEAAFPLLSHEVDRAVTYRASVGPIAVEDVDVGWRGDGIVRAMIHDNELYIIRAQGVWDHNHRPRAMATLHAIHRALVASSEPLPTIEFTITDHDAALDRDPNANHTTWAYSRLKHQESLWLMPDFGFWGWPDVGLRSYNELQSILEAEEDEFIDKIPKIVWRGSTAVGSADARQGLLHFTKNKPWADVQTLDWSNKSDIASKLLSMEDHCGYMYTAQTEGNSYSGRLKYLLNCHSVALIHELNWIEHYHHLLVPTGKDRNHVPLKRDFSDLPSKMKILLKPENIAQTQRIADNARKVFRERYLTPAAEGCYWRSLIRGWASVQGFEPQVFEDREMEDDWRGGRRSKRKFRGTPFESYAIMEEVEWVIPAKARKICIAE